MFKGMVEGGPDPAALPAAVWWRRNLRRAARYFRAFRGICIFPVNNSPADLMLAVASDIVRSADGGDALKSVQRELIKS
ncbi:hypothetical protein GWI33_001366 [Rhynchophorus ferrugineus]|uniref:Uncharacterized protein n=1 Tax=Rhynchophorus ferrugineus TaxID=354439 RepID=A0A834ILE4_RHYFE|nr:hypothetical protein GWI33_001366 [Rhynchophorus ferrugineus]